MNGVLLIAAVATQQAPAVQAADPAGITRPIGGPETAATDGEGDISFEPEYFADARPVTALDMVRRVPGFVFEAGDAVRGFASAGGNVLIDGARPSTKNLNIEDLLKAIPADQVTSIELIRTPRAGLDQQGSQVLVNVVRGASGTSSTSVTLSNYSYTQRALLPSVRVETNRRGSIGGWDAMFYLARNQDEGGNGRRLTLDDNGALIDDARIAVDGPLHGLESRLSGDLAFLSGTLRGNLSYTYQDYTMRETASHERGIWAGTSSLTDDSIVTQNAELSAEWSGQVGVGVGAKFLGLATRKTVGLRSTWNAEAGLTLYDGASRADERIVRVSLSGSLPKGQGWEITAEAAHNALDNRSSLEMDGIRVELANANVRVSEVRGDLGAKLSSPLANGVVAELVLRGELSQLKQRNPDTLKTVRNSFQYLKPKLLLRWDVAPGHQVSLRAEREIGQLDFTEFASSASLVDGTVQAGNADLRPQTAWILEGGIESRLSDKAVVSLAYRHHRIDNVLDEIVMGETNAPGNIGAGAIDAAVTQLTIPLGFVGIGGGRVVFAGEWRRSRVRDPHDGAMRAINGLSPFEGSISATLDRPALKSTIGLDVYFGQTYRYLRSNEDRETSAQPYVTAKWTYTLSQTAIFDFAIQNLLGRRQDRTVIAYNGLRGTGDVRSREYRWFNSTRGVFVSFRKTL